MRLLFIALILSACIHGAIFLALPSLSSRHAEDTSPKSQSIMITMSYKEPEPLKKQVPVPPKVTKPIKKKQKPPAKKITVKKEPAPIVKPEPVKEKPPEVEPPLDVAPEDTPLTNMEEEQKVLPPEPLNASPASAALSIETIHFSSPEYKNNPSPKYPRKAMKRGYEGLVEILVLISVHGQASEIKIQTSSGHSILDKQAVKTVKKWTFVPRTHNGKPVEVWVMVPVRFKLISK